MKIKQLIKKDKNDCLKCRYNILMKTGKKIFDDWDKILPAPKELIEINKDLIKLKKIIEKNKKDSLINFCAKHPDIYEFLPTEWA